jgi:hypothetical protein
MQARKLKALLNNTGYTVAFYDTCIGIGSPLCHDLIRLDVEDGKLKYALDTWRKGRESVLHHKELTFIWDKLHELVASGEMENIIKGQDEIENPLPVYTVRNGKLISTFTDAYGWPNTTIDGYMMHDNTYFKTVGEAVEYGIEEYEYRVKNIEERIAEVEENLDRLKGRKQEYSSIVAGLKSLTPSQKGDVLNTMNNLDPNNAQAQPANQEAAEQATGDAVQATEQNAQEQAMESETE